MANTITLAPRDLLVIQVGTDGLSPREAKLKVSQIKRKFTTAAQTSPRLKNITRVFVEAPNRSDVQITDSIHILDASGN